jgi:biopolymer transport protein TolQ
VPLNDRSRRRIVALARAAAIGYRVGKPAGVGQRSRKTRQRKSISMENEALTLAQNVDFSLSALFWRATFTVKLVMLILIFASGWAWAVTIQKYIEFARARRAAAAFDRAFWSGEPLDDLADRSATAPRPGPERVFAAGMDEYRKSHAAMAG